MPERPSPRRPPLAKSPFGSSLHSAYRACYRGHAATGGLRFSTITVEGGTRTYALDWNGGRQPTSRSTTFS